jgi:hypothetical protein
MASTYDLTIDQGATYALGIQLSENGSAMSLTGASVLAQIRKDPGSSLLATFTAVTSGTTAGYMSLSLTSSVTQSITPGIFHYDVLLTKAAGTKVRVLSGKATVSPAISLP